MAHPVLLNDLRDIRAPEEPRSELVEIGGRPVGDFRKRVAHSIQQIQCLGANDGMVANKPTIDCHQVHPEQSVTLVHVDRRRCFWQLIEQLCAEIVIDACSWSSKDDGVEAVEGFGQLDSALKRGEGGFSKGTEWSLVVYILLEESAGMLSESGLRHTEYRISAIQINFSNAGPSRVSGRVSAGQTCLKSPYSASSQ